MALEELLYLGGTRSWVLPELSSFLDDDPDGRPVTAHDPVFRARRV